MTEVVEQNNKPVGEYAVRDAGAVPALRFLRFLFAGALNALLSIAVYQAALFVTGHVAAYVIAYAAGILFAYFAYARHVFNTPLSVKRFMAFTLFYIASGSVGVLVNAVLIEHLTLYARVAIFLTVVVMLPLNYFGSKWCLRGTARQAP